MVTSNNYLQLVFFRSPRLVSMATPSTNTPQSILLKLDESAMTTKHKIGILFCRPGQRTEEEFYNNEHGSPAFEEFLGFLGNRVRLKGFGGYAGGLDVKGNTFPW